MNILMLYGFAPHTTANYLARAFQALGHDVRSAGEVGDLSHWEQPYRLWRHTWELRAEQPLDMGDWRPEAVVWVESGDMTAHTLQQARALGVPVAGWLIDTHNTAKTPWHRTVTPLLDHVFCAMRPAVQAYEGARWLPLACDPEVHTPSNGHNRMRGWYDVAWVGSNYGAADMYVTRFAALDRLRRRYRCHLSSSAYFEDMAEVYASAKMGWNMSLTGGDLIMRVFEVLCAGVPLVTDEAPESGIGDLFKQGAEWVMYRNATEMFAAIDALLEDSERREQIGAAGRAAVLEAHTYRHRAQTLLECMGC